MSTFFNDLRYAARQLLKSPGFTVVAVLTLALGIGANTAIFSVVNAVLLRPLSYRESERLVEILPARREGERFTQFSFPNFRDLRARSRSFSELAAFRFWIFTLSGSKEAESFLGVYVSEDMFAALGVQPALGRGFSPGSDEPGHGAEVVLSNAAWRNRYGADPGIVGQQVAMDGHSATVVGVLPRDFQFPALAPADAPLPSREPDVYAPTFLETDGHESRGSDNYWVIGRLAGGVPIAVAGQEVATLGRQLSQEFPNINKHFELGINSLQREVVGDSARPLLILLGAVGFVLLIACTNVAGLVLARAAGRRREFALRSALGASRSRLVRQLLTESLLLAVLGGGLGVLLAAWGLQAIRVAAPNSLPRVGEAALDGRMLLATLVISLLAGLLFGVSPALQSARHSPADALKQGDRATAGGRRHRLRGLLVISEVALSLVLLAGAGLLLRSFVRLLRVDPGFDGENVISMLAILPPGRYPDAASRRGFVQAAIERVQTLPGVSAAGVVNTLPLSNLGGSTSFQVVGQPEPPDGAPSMPYRTVAGKYFDALRYKLVSGKWFTEEDGSKAPLVAMINQATAQKFFAGEDPLGRLVQLGNDDTPRTIVGIVGDIHDAGLDQPVEPQVYYPFLQGPDAIFTLVARTSGDPHPLVPAIRHELGAIDPSQSVFLVRTMPELMASTLERRRFNLWLLAGFAATALGLAALGLYGIVAHSVTQRTREIGVRVALGAGRGAVLRLLLREGLGLALAGVGTGLLGALAVTRVLRSQLFGIGALDPVALLSVVAILFLVAVLATLIPARRALRVDPIVALRAE